MFHHKVLWLKNTPKEFSHLCFLHVDFVAASSQLCSCVLPSSAGSCMGEWRAAMTAEPDALAVVNQLRDLAADPMNRRAIVQDQGCLPGLILFLDHTNPQVVYSALLVGRHRRTSWCLSHLEINLHWVFWKVFRCWVLFQDSRFWSSWFGPSPRHQTHCDWLFTGNPLPGRMSSQPGEAEGRAGDDAEPPERRAEVSLI